MRSGYDSRVLNSESTQAFDRPLHTGHGGARPGAGRPAGTGYVKSEDQKDLDKAKARHESVKADLATLELKKRQGELVLRDAVKAAAATALATLAQGLRSVPDSLERKLNASPELTEAVGREIDAALNDLADAFEMLTGPDIPLPDDE
jgi:phage terminase Nu1 subunit (DNA packaging protein)